RARRPWRARYRTAARRRARHPLQSPSRAHTRGSASRRRGGCRTGRARTARRGEAPRRCLPGAAPLRRRPRWGAPASSAGRTPGRVRRWRRRPGVPTSAASLGEFREGDGARRGDILRDDLDPPLRELAQLGDLLVGEIDVPQALGAPRLVMDAAEGDAAELGNFVAEGDDGRDVTGEDESDSGFFYPVVVPAGGLVHRHEDRFHAGGHAHAVEVLLPVARPHLVVNQGDEAQPQRLAPPHHHLPVDEAVIHPHHRETHAGGIRMARPPASTARCAASAGGSSRWKTKSRSMARFTPVTTAMPRPWSRAIRTAPARHEPPGRSTKTTAGPSPMASPMRAFSDPPSHPPLVTGTSAPATPEMVSVAPTSDCASPAWETTTPRRVLLIVFLEIRADVPALPHCAHEPVVEFLGGVYAAISQEVVHGHHLTNNRQILAGVQGHRHEGQRNAQKRCFLAIQPGPVVLPIRVPVLELHHHLDALLLADGPDPEEGLDVDQPHPPDLHEVPRELVATSDQHVVPSPGDVDDIVGNQAVSALNEIEHALALADSGAPHEEKAHTEDVSERRVRRGGRSERVIEKRLEAPVELRGLQLGPHQGHAACLSELEELRRGRLALGDDDDRQLELEKILETPPAGSRLERREVADLGLAEDMDAVADEARGIPGEDQSRTRCFGRGNLPVEPDLPGQGLEL